MNKTRVWFITGAARGFGRLFAESALASGDSVIGTARQPSQLEDLHARYGGRLVSLPLDVRDRAAVFAAVEVAADAFGRLDIVINNAGYGLTGAVEEIAEDAARLGGLEANQLSASAACCCARSVNHSEGGTAG